MIEISNQEDLIAAFREIDRETVKVPHDLHFPLVIDDYYSWVDVSSQRTYLVFGDLHGTALGVVFRRGSSTGPDLPAAMCDWCHAVRGGGAVGLMTTRASKKRSIGLTLCRDLSCKDKARDLPNANDLRESVRADERIARIVTRMNSFSRRYLF